MCGAQRPVPVAVVPRAGDAEPGGRGPSALDVAAAPGGAGWAARFRHEDGVRAPQQRLGLAAGRAWTTAPLLRPFQGPPVALSWRRRQARLDQAWGAGPGWHTPAWHPPQRQAAILDLRRLSWRYRAAGSPCLVALEEWENIPQPQGLGRNPTEEAA